MKTELELNEMILELTHKIIETDPELLKHLNEKPLTVPYQENPEITVITLTSYYDSLVGLLRDYEENLTKSLLKEKVENLPVTEIITMELENSEHNLLTEANGISISYNDVGEGKIPVIFLHGFPFDKSMWKGQLEGLKSSNRLIACDIRGFGKSTDEKTPLSMDLFGDDLVSFMDKLHIQKANLCGLSMGGYIALNSVKRFPERFETLILCDTQCIADSTKVKENRYKAIEKINHDGPAEFNEEFIKNVFHPDSLTDKTELVKSLRSVVFGNSKVIIASGLTALAERSETCSALSSISIPTLIICGREDVVTPLEQSEFMHKQIKGSVLKVIDNAGHVSNLEQPEEFNKSLTEFLNSLHSISHQEHITEPIGSKSV